MKIIQPPSLSFKSYERYKLELLAWREVTEISKAKQGIVIALSLPEDDSHQIREKVFNQISLDDLKKENGLDTLIKFMDTHLKKDELTDSVEKYEDFEDLQRAENQSVNEYIQSFDAKYRKLEKLNIKLPAEVLAFKLLKRANVSREEKLLVLTGMNYANRETLYEEAKRSLKKFKGDITTGYGPSCEAGHSVLATKCVERHTEGISGISGWHSRKGGGQQQNDFIQSRKRKNPVGVNGKPLLCKSCGSYRHFVAECPDSWENMARNKQCKEPNEIRLVDHQNIVLFMGLKKSDNTQLAFDQMLNYAVLDSGCSRTVCGEQWLNSYVESLDEMNQKKVKSFVSNEVFKFGDGTCLGSKGKYSIPVRLAGKLVTIQTEVLESEIPLLLSKNTMKEAQVKIDLENDTAMLFGCKVALRTTSSGHYAVPIIIGGKDIEQEEFEITPGVSVGSHQREIQTQRCSFQKALGETVKNKESYANVCMHGGAHSNVRNNQFRHSSIAKGARGEHH